MQETLGKHVMYVKGECMLFAPLRNKIVTIILIIAMLKMVKQHQRKYKTKQENNRTY